MSNTIFLRRILAILVGITILTSIFFTTNIVKAEENSAGFYVSAELPDNQIDKNLSYFDLRMKPDQNQTINVKIFNEKNEDIKISVYATNASSNSNGIIDYSKKGIADESLKNPFETIAKPEEDIITVPANKSKTAAVKLNMPKDEFDGIILGGLVFKEITDENENAATTEESVSINNVISYALAVRLSESDDYKEIDLSLNDVEARVVNYTPVITHYIKNDAAALSSNMDMTIEIADAESGNVITSSENDNISIAPNSVMPYSLKLRDETLDVGKYISKVSITYKNKDNDDKTVKFEKEFSVDEEYKDAAEDYSSAQNTAPTWAKILIAGIAVLIMAITALIIIMIVRKRKNV